MIVITAVVDATAALQVVAFDVPDVDAADQALDGIAHCGGSC